jgi:hypothetical protein
MKIYYLNTQEFPSKLFKENVFICTMQPKDISHIELPDTDVYKFDNIDKDLWVVVLQSTGNVLSIGTYLDVYKELDIPIDVSFELLPEYALMTLKYFKENYSVKSKPIMKPVIKEDRVDNMIRRVRDTLIIANVNMDVIESLYVYDNHIDHYKNVHIFLDPIEALENRNWVNACNSDKLLELMTIIMSNNGCFKFVIHTDDILFKSTYTKHIGDSKIKLAYNGFNETFTIENYGTSTKFMNVQWDGKSFIMFEIHRTVVKGG